jgi:hypothetical protein
MDGGGDMTGCPSERSWRPLDCDLVQSAIRLGWLVAEVRGRNRPGGPKGTVVSLPVPVDDPLPLRVQRSPTELRIAAQAVVAHLARRLDVDTRPGRPSFGEAIDEAARALARSRELAPEDSDAVREAWDALAQVLWEFDGHAQDRLTAISDTVTRSSRRRSEPGR